jgi:hypothetical protein
VGRDGPIQTVVLCTGKKKKYTSSENRSLHQYQYQNEVTGYRPFEKTQIGMIPICHLPISMHNSGGNLSSLLLSSSDQQPRPKRNPKNMY